MLAQDRRVTLRFMSEELGINKDRVRTILSEDFGIQERVTAVVRSIPK
jgi:hypothetical protein